jgi:hypothetical protein
MCHKLNGHENKIADGIYSVVFILIMIMAFSGCATIKGWFANPDTELIMQLAVTDATFRTVQAKPEWKKPIENISSAAMAAIDNNQTTTLDSLTTYVNSKIPENLTPEEKALAAILIKNVQVSIQAYLEKHNVTDPAKQLIEVRKVLGWIHDAVVQ